MRVAIVHYHLRPGGVTSVVCHAVAALEGTPVRVAALAGAAPTPDVPDISRFQVVEALNYARPEDTQHDTSDSLLQRMKAAAEKALNGPPDIWHFHNHSIGKNATVPMAVFHLAGEGQRLLLQIHDFAEDGRPGNYDYLLANVGEGNGRTLGARLYPQGRHIHYAVLNGRDRALLERAGAAPERLHLLPNAVALDHVGVRMPPPAPASDRRLFLYPTRAIRRKNMGEFVLWSALGREGDRFGSTLAPTSPRDRGFYDQWTVFAAAMKLPVDFGLGLQPGASFQKLVESAHAVVTTSVAEGFGLAFLEPWLAGRPLAGRNLPELTRSFERDGIDLSSLYARLLVPLDWVGRERLRDTIRESMTTLLEAYRRKLQPGDVEKALDAAVQDGRVDFGRLDEDLQQDVIRHVARSPRVAAEMDPPELLPDGRRQERVERNFEATRKGYNLEQYGKRLEKIYGEIMRSEPGPLSLLSEERLLDGFLDPERFFLIRT